MIRKKIFLNVFSMVMVDINTWRNKSWNGRHDAFAFRLGSFGSTFLMLLYSNDDDCCCFFLNRDSPSILKNISADTDISSNMCVRLCTRCAIYESDTPEQR